MKKTTFLLLWGLFIGWSMQVQAQERIVFEEHFTDNQNGWMTSNDESTYAYAGEGAYQIERRQPQGRNLFLIDKLPLDPQQNFEISTTLTQTFGYSSDGYGFVWGAADRSNYFSLLINSAGQFRVVRYKDDTANELKTFTETENILAPQGQPNQLTIRRSSELISFYANQKFLYAIPARNFMGAKAGFVLYNKMEVKVSELIVRQNQPMPEIFADEFDTENCDWMQSSADSAISIQTRGKLYMRPAQGQRATFLLREVLLNTERDFEIEVLVRQIAGNQPKGYGLVWGAADAKNSYLFLINSFGSYSVYERDAGETKKLVNWTPSDQMLHLRVTPNKLVVRKSDKVIDLFLNDRWLTQLPFQAFKGNQLGFVLQGDLKIEMESMAVREGAKRLPPKPIAVTQVDPQEEASAQQPPVITLLQPSESEVEIDKKSIAFKAGIASQSKLKGIRLMVNDLQVPMQAKRDANGEYDLIIDQELPLKASTNLVKLMAKDENGLIQRYTLTVDVKVPDKPINRNGIDYALFFGTNDYEQWTDLTNPVNDVRTIAAELESSYGFNTELVLDANKKEVLKKLKEYARKKFSPNDQLLIFFAGHGKFDEDFKEGYVVTTNSEKNDEGNESYIAHSTLRTIVNNIPSKHTFLVMDVCFGGTIDPFIATSRNRGETDEGEFESAQSEFIERKMKFKTRRYLTSGGKEYVPDGTPGAHSPFARKFLEALRNYGGEDRIITLGELALFFERLVPEPRAGEFGTNEPGSDFLFIAR